MRRVHRKQLSENAYAHLCKRTVQIADAGNAKHHQTDKERSQVRKVEARSLWKQEKNKAFDEIDQTLRAMAPGNELCMYCEHSTGSDVDHFWPKEKYPGRAYTWENYLWACSICNTHYKGTQFPLDSQGNPLLVNPAEEEPQEHLTLTPTYGKLVGRTQKGEATIRVLGFDRRTNLDHARLDAWKVLQANIIHYAAYCARGDDALALLMQRAICRHPLASVLRTLFEILDSPRGASLIDPACIAALAEHPEIRSWP